MEQHTPTPWRTIKKGQTGFSDRNYIASNYGPINIRANAQFIVKACNTHEELVETCQGMFEVALDDYKDLPDSIKDGLQKLSNILATLED